MELEAIINGLSKQLKAASGVPSQGEVDLARTLIADFKIWVSELPGWTDHTREGSPIVVDGGAAYVYSPSEGIWVEIPRQWLICLAQCYNGAATMNTKDMRPLLMGARKAEGVAACVLRETEIIRPGFFDSPADGFAFANGFVRVTMHGAELGPHSPENRAVHRFDFDYDPAARAGAWVSFLDDLFLGDADSCEKQQVLAQFVGACLAGIAANYQRALVLTGTGGNGKSVFLDVVQSLFPPDAVTSSPPQGWVKDTGTVMLRGKALNAVSEMPESKIWDSSTVKAVISGDPVDGKHLYKDKFRFRPRCGHIFTCNDLPSTSDSSSGFWRRFIVIGFNRAFHESAGRRDPVELVNTLLAQRAGIMTWALNGASQLLRLGKYTIPPSMTEILSEWKATTCSVTDFVQSCCCLDAPGQPGTETALKIVHADFNDWAASAGRRGMSVRKLSEKLRNLGFTVRRVTDGRVVNLDVLPRQQWRDWHPRGSGYDH